jgi:ATP-dependent Clp protease protease subunit
MIPYVIEKSKDGERAYDIYSRLLEDRIIFLGSSITDDISNSIVAQLLLLNQQDSEKDIELYINSPGGVITSGLAIIDTIKFISADVRTICVGSAASMAAILLACGAKGKRFSLPNSRIMIHEPRMDSCSGTYTEQKIEVEELERLRDINARLLSDSSGLELADVLELCKNDLWMDPEKAKSYGIIDGIIYNETELKGND